MAAKPLSAGSGGSSYRYNGYTATGAQATTPFIGNVNPQVSWAIETPSSSSSTQVATHDAAIAALQGEAAFQTAALALPAVSCGPSVSAGDTSARFWNSSLGSFLGAINKTNDITTMALSPDGLCALVEFRAEDPNVPIKPEHKMTKEQIMQEWPANGFKLVEQFDKLPWQHLMFFEADAKKPRSIPSSD